MDHLPAEVLQQIVHWLVRDERKQFMAVKEVHEDDLTRMMRVSKSFYEITAPILYATVSISDVPLFAVGIDVPEVDQTGSPDSDPEGHDSDMNISVSHPSPPWSKRYLVSLIQKVELVYQDPDSTRPQVSRESISIPLLKHLLTTGMSPAERQLLLVASVCQVRVGTVDDPTVDIKYQNPSDRPLLPRIEANSIHFETYGLDWRYIMPGIVNRLYLTAAGRDQCYGHDDASHMGWDMEAILGRFEEFWRMSQWGNVHVRDTIIKVVCPYTMTGWNYYIFEGYVGWTGESEVKSHEDESEDCPVCGQGCMPPTDGSTHEDYLNRHEEWEQRWKKALEEEREKEQSSH